MTPQRQYYLFAYDIGCPKRQAKVRHLLQGYATGSQQSLFECWLTRSEYQTLCRHLPALLGKGDTLHCTVLSQNAEALLFGTAKPLRYHAFIIG